MTTVHIENQVRDFAIWKANFDKFEAFRAQHGVQSYRVSQDVADPNEVVIDLEFADEAAAHAFLPRLATIVSSPQAREQLVTHSAPRLLSIVSDRTLTPTS
jgi:quinol monooxygenase YgiN